MQPLGPRQDVGQVADLREQLLELIDDLVLLEAGEPVQAHVENGLRLRVGKQVTTGARCRARRFRLPAGC